MPDSLIPSQTPVYLGDEALTALQNWLKKQRFSSIFILVDENTLQHCLPRLVTKVKKLTEAEIIELESGEENKTPEVALQVWRVLSELGADRNSLLINLGGGVITDMGGFVASTFKRGISFIHLPTTLLAQIDAATGGKTGVNLDGLKNEVGTFTPAEAVFIYPDFLQTLSKREMLSGFAEAIKHAVIADPVYWEQIKTTSIADSAAWESIIATSVRIKHGIVSSDPKEANARKSLNFGHTIGHALETYFLESATMTLLHGEAVAIGMVCEAWLSHELLSFPENERNELVKCIVQRYLPVQVAEEADHRILELMRHDKKNAQGEIRFTLLKHIGQAQWDCVCTREQILGALQYYREVIKQVSIFG